MFALWVDTMPINLSVTIFMSLINQRKTPFCSAHFKVRLQARSRKMERSR